MVVGKHLHKGHFWAVAKVYKGFDAEPKIRISKVIYSEGIEKSSWQSKSKMHLIIFFDKIGCRATSAVDFSISIYSLKAGETSRVRFNFVPFLETCTKLLSVKLIIICNWLISSKKLGQWISQLHWFKFTHCVYSFIFTDFIIARSQDLSVQYQCHYELEC